MKKATAKAAKKSEGFSDIEKQAMKDRAQELKAARGKGKTDGTAEVLAKIAEMDEPDRTMAERLHALVMAAAPGLQPKPWYGMPAWYKDGKVLCHFVSATKFKTRYATLGFSDVAKLDDGNFWPNAYALVELDPATEAKITAVVKKAAG